MISPAGAPPAEGQLDAGVAERLARLREEGEELWCRFDREVRLHEWHPFVPADYGKVLDALLALRRPGLRFLEWGSATGVIPIMADLLGYEAYGIEIDERLADIARGLVERFGSTARLATGSYLPAGYEWRSPTGDRRLGSIGVGPSGYAELGRPLEDFDLVFAYPWEGEAPVMHDVMRRYGAPDARLLLYGANGPQLYLGGRLVG